ncbi:MAG: hypothetical protein M5U01_39400 [Ardenticatenaceae bacterium]|nr:hypothetical protein [Ardenticatenaceae bacterium]HBY94919.1 hypothetical protein [Chloroflexota bacterium]
MLANGTLLRLLFGVLILTAVTLVSQYSRRLAGIVSTLPVNITVALWVVYSITGSRPQAVAPLALGMIWGLMSTMLFVVICWYTLTRGWALPKVLLFGYAVWVLVAFAPRWLSLQR